jgi:TPP-dependent pyruvate/acetoin dehydrogenase alpha subunit
LLRDRLCGKNDIEAIDLEVENIIKDGIEFARISKLPEPEDALNDVYAIEYEGIVDKGWRTLSSQSKKAAT